MLLGKNIDFLHSQRYGESCYFKSEFPALCLVVSHWYFLESYLSAYYQGMSFERGLTIQVDSDTSQSEFIDLFLSVIWSYISDSIS